MNNPWQLATATAYNGKDDEFGSTTARPNLSGKCEAVANLTIAVDPKVIPYGSAVEIMLKTGISRIYLAHDTGTDVVSRKASKGRGTTLPVIDFYTPKDDLIAFNDEIGETVMWRIVS